jgi:hypothetical protein
MYGPDNARGPWDLLCCPHVFEQNVAPNPRSFACECNCPTCYEANQVKREPVEAVMVEKPEDVIRVLKLWRAHQDGSRREEIIWANALEKEVAPMVSEP